jgi:hypothetical protein
MRRDIAVFPPGDVLGFYKSIGKIKTHPAECGGWVVKSE